MATAAPTSVHAALQLRAQPCFRTLLHANELPSAPASRALGECLQLLSAMFRSRTAAHSHSCVLVLLTVSSQPHAGRVLQAV